jgi:hypothetical protein
MGFSVSFTHLKVFYEYFMNLFASILTSIIIVLAVWLDAIYQPTAAYAETITPSTTIDVAENNAANESPLSQVKVISDKAQNTIKKRVNSTPITSISGVQQNMLISNIDQLWYQFERNKKLHSKLKGYPSAIYVLYRNISKDFTRADITIGYSDLELKAPMNITIVPNGNYQNAIAGNELSATQLEKAWQKLDFGQNVIAVIERHQLNKSADVVNVSMQVMYK